MNSKLKILCLFLPVAYCGLLPKPVEECVSGKYPPTEKSHQVGWYKVNLDLPPQERWNEVVKGRAIQIRGLLAAFKKFVAGFSPELEKKLFDFVDKDVGKLLDSLPYPFADELRGMAKGANINEGEITLFNVFYEIFTLCTSVIAQDPNGKLYHARNLDFGLFLGWNTTTHTWDITEALKPLVVNLEWERNGTTVFKSVNFAGFLGILTGIKPGVFTMSMNERFNLNGGYIGIIEWLMGDHSASWMSFLTRRVMENATSYEQAQQWLSDTKLLAPGYYILGGTKPYQGCVITRARAPPAVDVWTMKETNHTWFILETNYDHWKSPLFLDDRRNPAVRCMVKKSQKNVGAEAIFNMLSSRPVLNKLTAYTAIMQVDSGSLETYLQDCPDPCWPW